MPEDTTRTLSSTSINELISEQIEGTMTAAELQELGRERNDNIRHRGERVRDPFENTLHSNPPDTRDSTTRGWGQYGYSVPTAPPTRGTIVSSSELPPRVWTEEFHPRVRAEEPAERDEEPRGSEDGRRTQHNRLRFKSTI